MKRLLLPLLVVVCLLVAGCGSGDSEDKSVLVDAAAKTVDRGSARIAMDGSIAGPGLPDEVPIEAAGVIDNKERKGQLDFDFSALADALPGGTGLSADDFKGEMIIDDLVVYMRFPFFERLLQQSGKWIKIDAEKIGEAAGVDLGQFNQLSQTDPSQSLQYLRAVSGDVEEVGSEDVRGVATTHYKADVDLDQVPEVLPESQRESTRKAVDALIDQLGTSEIPVEVWVDDQGLVRRLRQEFEFEGEDGKASFTIDIEMFDFGVAVDAQPPPEEDTLDITELAGAGALQGQ